MHDFERDYAFGVDARPTAYFNDAQQAVFQGFRQANGRIGTRNYIGVLTSVNCSATAARYIADAITPAIMAEYPNRSEEHTSELQSIMRNSYAVFCLKKKKNIICPL